MGERRRLRRAIVIHAGLLRNSKIRLWHSEQGLPTVSAERRVRVTSLFRVLRTQPIELTVREGVSIEQHSSPARTGL